MHEPAILVRLWAVYNVLHNNLLWPVLYVLVGKAGSCPFLHYLMAAGGVILQFDERSTRLFHWIEINLGEKSGSRIHLLSIDCTSASASDFFVSGTQVIQLYICSYWVAVVMVVVVVAVQPKNVASAHDLKLYFSYIDAIDPMSFHYQLNAGFLWVVFLQQKDSGKDVCCS